MDDSKPDVVAYLIQDKDIPDMRGVRLHVDKSCQSTKVDILELMTVAQHNLVVAGLLEFVQEVRRSGDTRLASMAISVIAKSKGGAQ